MVKIQLCAFKRYLLLTRTILATSVYIQLYFTGKAQVYSDFIYIQVPNLST